MPKPFVTLNKCLVLLGILTGVWAIFSPGTLFVILITILLFYILNLNLRVYSDRKAIITICAIAIAVRFFLAISNYYFSYSRSVGSDLIGDARAYSGSGQYIAEAVTGRPMPNIDGNEPEWVKTLRDTYKGAIPISGYRIELFSKYVGLTYSLFGYDPIAVKLINSFLSVLTGILLFFLLKGIFSIETAKICLFLSLFWPSIFLWSVTGSKDPLTFFLITLMLYIFYRLRKHINFFEFLLLLIALAATNYMKSLLLLIGISLIIMIRLILTRRNLSPVLILLILMLVMKVASDSLRGMRYHIFLPLLMALFLSSAAFLGKKWLVTLSVLFFCLGLFLPFYIVRYNNIIDINSRFAASTEVMIVTHRSQLAEASSGYRIYPDRFYSADYPDNSSDKITVAEFALSYIKGLSYALFSPFPWSVRAKAGLVIYFQIIFYYILFPFILLGILVALRYRWRDILPAVIFVFIISSMYALYEGNIGTVFRHRDLLTVLFIFFGAIGISKVLGYRALLRSAS